MVFAMHWHESAMDLQYLLFAIILQPLPVDLSQFGAPSPFFSLLFKFPIFYKIEHLFSSSQKPSRNISVPSKFVLFLAPAENPDKLLFESEKWKLLSCKPNLCDPWNIQSMEYSKPEYSSGQLFHSPADLPNPGLPHCRQILYQLSHKGGPIFSLLLLNFVAYIFLYNNNKTFQDTGYIL